MKDNERQSYLKRIRDEYKVKMGDVMTILNNLEQAQEAKYSLELVHHFKVITRRNYLMGLWLGEKMGLQADDLHLYAQSIVDADFKKENHHANHEDVIEKLLDDIKKNNLSISEDQIRRKMDYYTEKAEEEFKNK